MRRARLVPFFAFLLLAGCLRVGPGEDLHLVCEERTASPRKAYDIGFLVAQTRVEGRTEEKERVAMLEAARHHVITLGGRPHEGFSARLSLELMPDDARWLFEAAGTAGARPVDEYRVWLWKEGATWVGGAEPGARGLIRPPISVAQPAWNVANTTPEVRDALGEGSAPRAASWEQALPSCVRLTYADPDGTPLEAVVNVVQGRVVFLDAR